MTDATQQGERHLSADSFERCLRSRDPVEHRITGGPSVTLFIDPDRQEVGLRVPAMPSDGPVETGRENVRVIVTRRADRRFLEVVVDDPALFTGAYPILCAVADRIQLDHLDLPSALAATVRLLDQLLKRDASLTTEREIGLLGELLIVRNLCSHLSIADALAAWRSSEVEEHDFSVYGVDIEVKTTSAERRSHWIASLTQLVATGDRPLWLISNQITRAGAGNGRSLAEVVTDIRQLIGNDQHRAILEQRLTAAGWDDAYERTVRDRWLLRAPSVAFAVADDFPRLTPSLLTAAGLTLIRISELRYRIDLTGFAAPATAPDIVTAILPLGDAL
jgi:hypothetical protein